MSMSFIKNVPFLIFALVFFVVFFASSDEDDDDGEDVDENSMSSTHTLTNEAFNDQPSNGNNKQGRTERSNEGMTEGPSSSSPSSGGDGGISSALSSGSISLPPTPADTPLPTRKAPSNRRNTKHGNGNCSDGDTKSMVNRTGKKKRNRLGEVREVEEQEHDTDSSTTRVCSSNRVGRRMGRRQLSVSNATLTKVSVAYS